MFAPPRPAGPGFEVRSLPSARDVSCGTKGGPLGSLSGTLGAEGPARAGLNVAPDTPSRRGAVPPPQGSPRLRLSPAPQPCTGLRAAPLDAGTHSHPRPGQVAPCVRLQASPLAHRLSSRAVPRPGLGLLPCPWLWPPQVLVRVFPGGVCGASPAGKLLVRRLRKSGTAVRGMGSMCPETLCRVSVRLRCGRGPFEGSSAMPLVALRGW